MDEENIQPVSYKKIVSINNTTHISYIASVGSVETLEIIRQTIKY